MNHQQGWRLAIDIGGTFTDVVLQQEDRRWTSKVLTRHQNPEDGVIEAISVVLDDSGAKAGDIGIFVLGTTLATNALIERKGARTALLTTQGFRDTLEIGWEHRFAQYDILQQKPSVLVPRCWRHGVPERLDVNGDVVVPLDEAAVRQLARQLQEQSIESVAIAFLHSFTNPVHEQRAGALLRECLPGLHITLSSDVCPEIREYERVSTACANAYVQPIMAGYLQRLEQRLADYGLRCPVYLMTSSGHLTTLEKGASEPVRLVESGPAGGAILARTVAQQCQETRVLSYDMGGTTAKVCFIDDYTPLLSRMFEFGRVYRFQKGSGLPIRIPVIEMVEIGAGGGSVARVDDMQRVQVGPDSAGSEPGPACFGRGGVLPTVTDANCVMGLFDPERFANGRVALQPSLAGQALAAGVAEPLRLPVELGAYAVTEMVTENMSNAARVHAMEQGKNVADYTVIAFGGAAPLHAARLGSRLDVRRIIVPLNASVGSALGFLTAPVAFQSVRSWYVRLPDMDMVRANALLDGITQEAQDIVLASGARPPFATTRTVSLRYAGQGHEITIELPPGEMNAAMLQEMTVRFETAYRQAYGQTVPGSVLEATNWLVTVSAATDDALPLSTVAPKAVAPSGMRRIFEPVLRKWCEVPCYDRNGLPVGAALEGPALITEAQTTILVTADFTASINSAGHVVMDRRAQANTQEQA